MALNVQNLRVPTSEEAREIGRKGGLASAKARRERKMLKETMLELLAMPLADGEAEEIQNIFEAEGKNISAQTAISVSMLKKAMAGDVNAYNAIRDIIGQKPVDQYEEIDSNVKVVELTADKLVAECYNDTTLKERKTFKRSK